MLTCGRNKKQNGYGRKMRVICGKEAKFQQEDGLPLCENHFKKWFKKTYKIEYSEMQNQLNEILNPVK